MIYLASPYSHRDPAMRHRRYQDALIFTARAIQAGHHVISPIVHNHTMIVQTQCNTSWEQWQHYDLDLLGRCVQLWVLRLKGWEQSVGVQAEIQFASNMLMPIYQYDTDSPL